MASRREGAVRSAPVTRTGNRPLSSDSGPLSRAQQAKLEQQTARRRDAEARQHEFWSHTSNYFQVLNQQNSVYDGWNAPSILQKSEMNYHKERSHAADAAAKEEERLDRRNKYLDEARKAFENESRLNRTHRHVRAAAAPHHNIRDLRDEYERLQQRRFERQQQEVEEKMLQHYQINNPDFRELQFKTRQALVQKAWEKQVEELKEKRAVEEKENEAARRREELAREREAERRKEEDLRRGQQLERWKQSLAEQQKELVQRREEEVRLKHEIALENQRQKELFEAEATRKAAEERRIQQDLGEFLKRQHRLKLLAKARQVEEELEEDRKILEDVAAFRIRLEEKEQEARAKQLDWLKDVLEQQKEEERKRRKEMDLLFTEEAKDMWQKQARIWEQEKEARKKLMDDVLKTLSEQTQEKLKLKEKRQDDIEIEKKVLQDQIKSLQQDIEFEERKQLHCADIFVQDLDKQVEDNNALKEKKKEEEKKQELTLKDIMVWEQKCRDRNELAQKLTKIAIESEDDKGIFDFRRKKVKWY